MSEISADYLERLNLQEQLVRIEQMRAEGDKFQAEQCKLAAEQQKWVAEAMKPGRDRQLAPWLAIVGLIGGIITVLAAIAHLGRS